MWAGKEGQTGKKMVFFHLESLSLSSSPGLHLTQLAAVSPGHETLFLPVLPGVLPNILDKYRVEGNLLQALSMTRDENTFKFGSTVLVEEVPRIECVTETAALQKFIEYLENIGPDIVLVLN